MNERRALLLRAAKYADEVYGENLIISKHACDWATTETTEARAEKASKKAGQAKRDCHALRVFAMTGRPPKATADKLPTSYYEVCEMEPFRSLAGAG